MVCSFGWMGEDGEICDFCSSVYCLYGVESIDVSDGMFQRSEGQVR